jgi:diguanylate cyclase (GGDEF)-like protein/PAS domain S-box-containing protein
VPKPLEGPTERALRDVSGVGSPGGPKEPNETGATQGEVEAVRKSGPVNGVPARPTGALRGAARWLALVLVVNVALGMAFSVIALRVEADRVRDAEVLLSRVSEQSSLLGGLAWRAIATERPPDAALAAEMTEVSVRVESALRELGDRARDLDLPGFPPVQEAVHEHLAAVEEQVRLLSAGKVAQARAFGEERSSPSLRRLLRSTGALKPEYERLARRASRIADLESILMMVLGVLLVALLFRRFAGARRFADSSAEERARSEARFRAVAQSPNDAVVSTDAEGTIVFWNEGARRIFGYTEQEAMGQPVTILMPERHRAGHVSGLGLIGEAGGAGLLGKTEEMEGRRKDGTEFAFEISLASWSVGDESFYTGMIRDITDRKHAENALRESEARLRAIVEQVPAIVYTAEAGPAGRWLFVSPQVESLLGFTPDEWMADPELWFRQLHPEDRERVVQEESGDWADLSPAGASEYRMLTKQGRVIWVRDVGAIITNHEGVPLYWSGVLSDITDRRMLEEQLEHQAFHDTLTGLANRALFVDRVEHALARSERDTDSLAVVFLDLDDFKTINDSLGHEWGDRVLVEVAARLERALRPGDTVARLGGDEFAILLEGAPLEDAIHVVERIIQSLEEPILQDTKTILVHASFGIALTEGRRWSGADLLRNADVAMYAAKARGGGGFEVFQPDMHIAALRRLDIHAQLQHAIHERQFVLHYQPIIELGSGRTVAVEALIRWDHPSRGLVPPLEFIPVAEESDLIVQIGRWVLQEACHQVSAWQREFPSDPPLTVNVNVSGKQFQHPRLVDEVAEVLRTSGIAPGSLTLEITESLLIQDTEGAVARLQELKALGVRVAVDDFGTGYSSLGYLQRFPIDTLKIDKAFVDAIGEGAEGSAIVRAIVSLGESLSMGVSAEGIESAEQLALLQDLRCDMGQGFYFSKPQTAGGIGLILGTHPSGSPAEEDGPGRTQATRTRPEPLAG